MVCNIGQMGHIMKVNGNITKHKDKVYFGMLKEMCTRESSKMIWLMVLVSILISMDLNIGVNLEMIFKRAKEKKSGLMEPNILVPIVMV